MLKNFPSSPHMYVCAFFNLIYVLYIKFVEILKCRNRKVKVKTQKTRF